MRYEDLHMTDDYQEKLERERRLSRKFAERSKQGKEGTAAPRKASRDLRKRKRSDVRHTLRNWHDAHDYEELLYEE